MDLLIFTDGGGGGKNHKPFACAAVLYRDGHEIRREGRPLGHGHTNNTAEWLGLILGLEMAAEVGAKEISLHLDSMLVVEQALSNWRVREEKLKPLYYRAQKLAANFSLVLIKHVPREQNRIADAICREMIEGQIKL